VNRVVRRLRRRVTELLAANRFAEHHMTLVRRQVDHWQSTAEHWTRVARSAETNMRVALDALNLVRVARREEKQCYAVTVSVDDELRAMGKAEFEWALNEAARMAIGQMMKELHNGKRR